MCIEQTRVVIDCPETPDLDTSSPLWGHQEQEENEQGAAADREPVCLDRNLQGHPQPTACVWQELLLTM